MNIHYQSKVFVSFLKKKILIQQGHILMIKRDCKDIIRLQNIYISNNCCTFELLVILNYNINSFHFIFY